MNDETPPVRPTRSARPAKFRSMVAALVRFLPGDLDQLRLAALGEEDLRSLDLLREELQDGARQVKTAISKLRDPGASGDSQIDLGGEIKAGAVE